MVSGEVHYLSGIFFVMFSSVLRGDLFMSGISGTVSKRFCTVTSFAVAICLGTCLAGIAPVKAGMQYESSGGYYVPSGSWLVAPGNYDDAGRSIAESAACVMANQYSNGYVVRFSGGGGSIMAMSVDIRDPILVKGDSYETALGFPGGTQLRTNAVAFNDTTLVFDLRTYTGIYDTLMRDQEVSLTVGDNSMRLSLAGFTDGMARLENCFEANSQVEDVVEPVIETETVVAETEIEEIYAPEILPAPDVLEDEVMEVVEEIQPEEQIVTEAVAEIEYEVPHEIAPQPEVVADSAPQSVTEVEEEVASVAFVAQESISEEKFIPVRMSDSDHMIEERLVQETQGDVIFVQEEDVSDTVSPPSDELQKIEVQEKFVETIEEPQIQEKPEAQIQSGIQQEMDDDIPADEAVDVGTIISKEPQAGGYEAAMQEGGNLAEGTIVWRAREGEDIKTVLSQWAQIAGYEFAWKADNDGLISHDFSFEGSFEDAVDQLMIVAGMSSGITARIKDMDGYGETASVRSDDSQDYLRGTWRAIGGSSVHSLLQMWAQEAGIDLVWESDADFRVKQNLEMFGSFEMALQKVLSQFEDDNFRPVGVLHMNKSSGSGVLIIRTGGPS